MTREEVFTLVQNHLADELDLDPARIDESTRFKEDLEADSLDLYTLVQELEDTYGIRMPDEDAARILTVGAAVDNVLGLAVTTWLYPRLEAERFGAGRLTKIRAQAVSGPACREVAERLGVPERLTANAPDGIGHAAETLVETERVLASITEAIIGACYLHLGYETTAEAVVEAFQPEIEEALANPVDFKSTLQERLARGGDVVEYEVAAEHGPPHERVFDVVAVVDGEPIGSGSGRSKKHAEQEAAKEALDASH